MRSHRFELPPPFLGLAPAGQRVAELVAIFLNQVHALAAGVPEQIQVGGEMHIGFQHVGVHLDFKRREGRAAFFCEHLASGGGDARVDLLEQLVIEQGDVVPQGLMAEDFGLLAPRRGGHAQHLAHEGIVVGDVFQAIPVRVQTQAHDAQHQDLPQIHAGAAGGLLCPPARRLPAGRESRPAAWDASRATAARPGSAATRPGS